MQIIYCDTCGMRISEADLATGAASQNGPQNAMCAKCAQSERPTKTIGRPPTRENAVLTRRQTGPAPAVSRLSATPRAPAKKDLPWLPIGIGISAGVFGLLMLFFAGGKKTPPKDAPPPEAVPAVIVEKPAPVPPKPDSPKPVEISRPAVTPENAPPAAAAIEDIRESFARRKWESVKADYERSPNGWGRSRIVSDFASTYASTPAGKEAAEYFKKLAVKEPPVPAAGAAIYAKHSRDFKAATLAPGWRYLWNKDGPIGDSGKYAPLIWNAGKNIFCGDATVYPGGPAGWSSVQASGVHPGPGGNQGAGFDHFVIAAYTLQSGQSGNLGIALRIHRHTQGAGGQVELRVYVNDALKNSMATGSTSAALDLSDALGVLKEGDTVYVAVGPDHDDGNDSTSLDFSIFPIP